MIGLFWGYSVSVQAEELPYKNPNLPIEERVNDLLKRMTIEEKFWQIYMMPGDLDAGKERFKDGIFGFQVSTVGADDPQMRQMLQYNPKLTAAETVKKVNQIQRYFVEETRLGIPAIIFDEALHGLVRGGATAFPQAIALAATFDTTLVSRVAHAIAMETKSSARSILCSFLPIPLHILSLHHAVFFGLHVIWAIFGDKDLNKLPRYIPFRENSVRDLLTTTNILHPHNQLLSHSSGMQPIDT